jgi:alpha-N-acetylglucosamine transferase
VDKLDWECNIPNWTRYSDAYIPWLDSCFTKLMAFQLTVYDFLLLLDADMMALNTVDDLFSIFDKKV